MVIEQIGDRIREPAHLVVPDVSMPGQLDAEVIRNWARRLATTCQDVLCEEVGPSLTSLYGNGDILQGFTCWHPTADAVSFMFELNAVECGIVLPSPVAMGVLAGLLGFDTLSDTPFGSTDLGILAAWLQPVADGIAALAALTAGKVHKLGENASFHLNAGPLVVLEIVLTGNVGAGGVQAVVPWEVVRAAVCREISKMRETISIDALLNIPVHAEAFIGGGEIAIRECMGLEAGDVVVLDGADKETVELRLRNMVLLRGSLGSHATDWALKVGEHSASEALEELIGGVR